MKQTNRLVAMPEPASEKRQLRLSRRAFVASASLAAAGVGWSPLSAVAASRQDLNSLGTWAAAPVSAAPADANRINNQTIRQIVRVSLGGDSVRVKLSNRYGSSVLVIQSASISLRNGNDQIIAGSGGQLKFSGKSSFTIPAYGELYSDWLPFSVASLTDVAIDLYIASDTSASTSLMTLHNVRPAGQIASYLAAGNQVGVASFPTTESRAVWHFLTGVDVSNPKSPGAIACFGDSITDGTRSTLYADGRYPDYLASRLIYSNLITPMGVVNLGISGNRVLMDGTGDNALSRFDRDVLTQTGVSSIIVLEGINDISGGNTAPRIIEGHRQLIQRAHARRIKIFGATLTPYGAAPQAREDQRQAVNDWIRTSGEYDGVIDFDVATRDPANPRVMRAQYDSGDTLHPNSAGYAAMAAAVDLNLFAGPRLRR
jgi:lysophospholipase L1-like esterase